MIMHGGSIWAIREGVPDGTANRGTRRTTTTFEACADIILSGGTADYDGWSGPVTFNDVGDPTEASIGIYQYGEDNTYVPFK